MAWAVPQDPGQQAKDLKGQELWSGAEEAWLLVQALLPKLCGHGSSEAGVLRFRDSVAIT